MADKKNLCAQIDTALHARVRQEQEQSGQTLSEFVEQLITDYYKMKENSKMTGDKCKFQSPLCQKNSAEQMFLLRARMILILFAAAPL